MYEKIKHFIRRNAWYDFGIWAGISIVLAGLILLWLHERWSLDAFVLVAMMVLIPGAVIILCVCQHRLSRLRSLIQSGGTVDAFKNESWISLEKGLILGRNWLVQQNGGHVFLAAQKQIQDLHVERRLDGNGILQVCANGRKMNCLLDLQNHPELENILVSWQQGSSICPACLGINDPENHFCMHCGTPLQN
ncbi:MAG: hypothetical protein SOI44_05965 [Lactimicrobium sp.]|uniref:hypothetical protein n=1 Tax=Lactimicrobium sp. TaxID=2563780 RepID=UPI002F35EFD8